MKISYQLILPLVALSTLSCTMIEGETQTSASFEEGVPGGEVTETTTITATVTGIDTEKRKLTFVTPEGNKFSSEAGPEVLNFEHIRVGDQLKSTLTEEVVIRMLKPGEKISDYSTLQAELTPIGAKPGVKTTESNQVVATVTDINTRKRKVRLQFADGKSKRYKVRPDIDLSKRSVGEKVLISVTETIAIKLEKP
ncbi:hypothetical protein [Haloferula sp.]|uniref:hypothetical protein n=1 Tax=Haloferula sp. TaxID=2497595 RepID=UPI00329C920D